MFSSSDLKKLEEAISSGVLRVRYAEREVWYQSIGEMLKARGIIKNMLQKNRSHRIKSSFTKGLDQ